MAVNYKELSDADLNKKIKGAEIAVSRASGNIKAKAEGKLKALKDELERRGSEVEKEAKKEVKEVKKEAKEVEKKATDKAKKYWLALDSMGKKYGVFIAENEEKADEYIVDNFDIDERDLKELTKAEYDKEKKVFDDLEPKPRGKRGRKPKAKTEGETAKKTTKKKSSSPTEKFELVIDGKTFTFDDLKSKQECERAKAAVEARYKESKAHKEATKKGIAASKTVSVTRRISDGFASIARKAVSEVPKVKIQKKPEEIKKELAELESAFDSLFDKIGDLIGKSIPQSQRKQIMDILTKFEDKVDKGSSKKAAATSKVKKEDGGFAGADPDDSWSYASFL